MKKQILIIGAAESIFVIDFIRQYVKRGVEVDLLALTPAKNIHKVGGVRRQVNCFISTLARWKITNLLVSAWRIQAALRKLDRKYDCVIIHFVNPYLAFVTAQLRQMSGNIVSVIWGSDFYQSRKFQRVLQKIVYVSSATVVFTNPETQVAFELKDKTNSKKLKVARFGLPVLDEIALIKAKGTVRDALCDSLCLPTTKVLVMAGYNANPLQNHMVIIDHFSRIETNLRNTMHLVFPLGYGDKGIERLVREKLADLELVNFTILTEFMNFEKVARLRCVTDILINVQASDQFSGSMQETLYAGGGVIAGAWLPYSELIAAGARIRSINHLTELSIAIVEEFETLPIIEDPKLSQTKIYIEEKSSWSSNLLLWDKIIFAEQ